MVKVISYAELFQKIEYKMISDLVNEMIEIDEFRRISRGLNAIGTYLDHKERLI